MYKNFILTESEREQILNMHKKHGYKKPLNEQAFNDASEPMMTHQQYNDYSEPSEPEYGDDNYDEEGELDYLKKELEKEGLFLETWDGEEYFIRCRDKCDFMIYFEGETIKINEYNAGTEESRENTFNVNDALDYIVSDKNKFYSYEESAKARDKEYEIDARNRYNNSMERGSFN
jgi:hypothetical protein